MMFMVLSGESSSLWVGVIEKMWRKKAEVRSELEVTNDERGHVEKVQERYVLVFELVFRVWKIIAYSIQEYSVSELVVLFPLKVKKPQAQCSSLLPGSTFPTTDSTISTRLK
jgi:hypothetical protein